MTAVEVTGWLDRLEATHQAATPGPWTPATAPSEDSDESHAEYLTGALRPDEGRPLWVAWAPVVEGLHDDSDYVVPVVTGDGPASEANARFVAEAHASLPQLLAAVRGVLDKHSPIEWFEEVEPGDEVFDLSKPLGAFCRECTDDEYVEAVEGGYAIDQGSPVVAWPCPTVSAMAAALGAEVTGR